MYTQLEAEELRQSLKHNEEIIEIQHKRMEQMEKQLSNATTKLKSVRSPAKQTYSPGIIHYVTSSRTCMIMTEKKGSRKVHKDQSRSPSPRNISFTGSSSSFPSFGRWTAHRAYVKKVKSYDLSSIVIFVSYAIWLYVTPRAW